MGINLEGWAIRFDHELALAWTTDHSGGGAIGRRSARAAESSGGWGVGRRRCYAEAEAGA